jgi:hypothetical protein
VEEDVRRVKRLLSDALGPAALILIVLVGGFLLWLLPEAYPNRYSELGAALISGGIVALAILALEQSLAQRQQKRDLQLQLVLGNEFPGIDLRDADLSGAYLMAKTFTDARFQGADLRGANLAGANLTNARLDRADLRGTIMYAPALYPSETLLPSENLYPSDGLPEATISGASFKEAWYNDATQWPSRVDNPEDLGAIKVAERAPEWRRWFGA